MHRHQRRAGFSVIELVIFLAALVVLVAVAAPRLIRSLERERAPVMIEVVDSLPAALAPGATEQVAIRLLDARGTPVRGRAVEIASAAGDSVAPARPHTDTTGVARFTIHVRGDTGARAFRVHVPGSTIEKQLSTVVRAVEAPAAPQALPASDTAAASPEPE